MDGAARGKEEELGEGDRFIIINFPHNEYWTLHRLLEYFIENVQAAQIYLYDHFASRFFLIIVFRREKR